MNNRVEEFLEAYHQGESFEQNDLSGLDLSDLDLMGIILEGASLKGTSLVGTKLGKANLQNTDFSNSNLHWSVLTEADFTGANLTETNLSGADLDGANLTGVDLTTTCLDNTDLSNTILKNAILPEGVPTIPDIHKRVFEAASQEKALDMGNWHSTCGTAHCRAGWVVHLAGDAGYALEEDLDTSAAAALIYQASDPTLERIPDFYTGNDTALADMRERAEASLEIIL